MSTRCPSYITKNRLGIYILQIRIPNHIRHNQPNSKALVQRSLRTRNRSEALRKARKMVVWMEENNFDIDKWESDVPYSDELTHIGLPLFEQLMLLSEEGDPILLDNFFEHLSGKEFDALSHVSDQNNNLIENIRRFQDLGNEQDAARLLALAPRVLKNSAQKNIVQLPKINPGQPVNDQQIEQKADSKLSQNDRSLNEAFEKWKEFHKPPAMTKSSYDEYVRMITLFLGIIEYINNNEIPKVSELTSGMINEYKELFEKIPKRTKIKNRSIKELIESNGALKSPTTIKNTYVNVGHFIHYLDEKAYPIDKDIHKVLTSYRKIKKREVKVRVPLDDKDLKSLFESDNYRKGLWKRSSEFWVPLIALFTGGTRNEIVQLEADDIYQQDGYYIIDINERGDKQLKESGVDSEGSSGRPRMIPVHPQLIKMGLVAFVDHQRKNNEKRLFPCEPRNNRGHFGAFGNRFTAYRQKVGVLPRYENELRDFHSFRHLLRTRLDKIHTGAEGICDDILGHTSSSRSKMGKTYSHEHRIELKHEAISKITFHVDFDVIKPWQQQLFAKNLK